MASGSGNSSSCIVDGSSSIGNHGGNSNISDCGGSSSIMVLVLVVMMIVINDVCNFIFLSNRKDTSDCHFTCCICIVDEATQARN